LADIHHYRRVGIVVGISTAVMGVCASLNKMRSIVVREGTEAYFHVRDWKVHV
jgi:hypothetical protein